MNTACIVCAVYCMQEAIANTETMEDVHRAQEMLKNKTVTMEEIPDKWHLLMLASSMSIDGQHVENAFVHRIHNCNIAYLQYT